MPGSSTSLLQELGQVSALPRASVVSSLCVANMGPTVTAIARIRCNWSAQNGAWLEPARDKHRMPFSRHHGHKQHHRYYDPASWLEDREGETAGFAETARPTAKPSAPLLPLSSPLLTCPFHQHRESLSSRSGGGGASSKPPLSFSFCVCAKSP